MVGGTTSGYSLMGSRDMAISPIRKIRKERTPAKIGRRMKKLEMFIGLVCQLGWECRVFPAFVLLVQRLATPKRAMSASSSCGVTAAPGLTRCRPLTTILSPDSRPERTMRFPLIIGPSFTAR